MIRSVDFTKHSFDVIAVASIETEGGSHTQDRELQDHLSNVGYQFHGRIMRTLWFVRNGFQGAHCSGSHWQQQEARLHAKQSLLATESQSQMDESLALFALARLEQLYIVEWALYHLALGVDKIYIYDNEDLPTYHLLFPLHPQVVVIHIRASLQPQAAVLEHFLAIHKSQHTWACHVDIDEFLNLRPASGFGSIKDLLLFHIPVRANPALSFPAITRWHPCPLVSSSCTLATNPRVAHELSPLQSRPLRRDSLGNIVAALPLAPAMYDSDQQVYYVDQPVTARFTHFISDANATAERDGLPFSILRTFVKVIFLCKYVASFEGPHVVVFTSEKFVGAIPVIHRGR